MIQFNLLKNLNFKLSGMQIRTLLMSACICSTLLVHAQDEGKQKILEIYGFAMADAGYNVHQINPAWFGDNPPPPHFMTYVAVDDVDENSKLAQELGATIIRGPMDIPNVGRICIIQDPTGAMISTFRMKN